MFIRMDNAATNQVVADNKIGVRSLGCIGLAKSIWSGMTSSTNNSDLVNYTHIEYRDNTAVRTTGNYQHWNF